MDHSRMSTASIMMSSMLVIIAISFVFFSRQCGAAADAKNHSDITPRRVPLRLFITAITESGASGRLMESMGRALMSDDDPAQEHSRRFRDSATRYGLNLDYCPNGGEPERDMSGNARWCQVDAECRQSYECVRIIGLIHFTRQIRYCCPTRNTLCTLKPKRSIGMGDGENCNEASRTIYYFDAHKLQCLRERVADCDWTSGNRFQTLLECRNKCETTACELGESILLERKNDFDRPRLCGKDGDCPQGYTCRDDRLFHRRVCCGFKVFEPCPIGFLSFTVPFTGHVKTCSTLSPTDECPADYVCVANESHHRGYCCAPSNHGTCPWGQQPYIHPLTDRSIKCNPQTYNGACPAGYTCSPTALGSQWGFCCSQAIVENCPIDTHPLLNHFTKEPVMCRTGRSDSCPRDYECAGMRQQASTNDTPTSAAGFCCSIPSDGPILGATIHRSRPAKSAAEGSTTTDHPKIIVSSASRESHEIREQESPGSDVTTVDDENGVDGEVVIATTVPSYPVTTSDDEDEEEEEDATGEGDNTVGGVHPPPSPSSITHPPPKASNGISRSEELSSVELLEARGEKATAIDNSPPAAKIVLVVTGSPPPDSREQHSKHYHKKHSHHKKCTRHRRKKKRGPSHRGEYRVVTSRYSAESSVPCHSGMVIESSMDRNRRRMLRCPRNYRPVVYPETRNILHCSLRNDDEAETDDCPAPSVCLYAVGAHRLRSICCAPIEVRHLHVLDSRSAEDEDSNDSHSDEDSQSRESRKRRHQHHSSYSSSSSVPTSSARYD